MRVPFSSHPPQLLLLFVFLMVVILTEVKWNLNDNKIFQVESSLHLISVYTHVFLLFIEGPQRDLEVKRQLCILF
jgi:hypothetical protein